MNVKLTFVFFGTPSISVIVLRKLVDAGYIPAAVVTNPDRPVGRKQILTPPPVKQFILERGLPTTLFQPEKLSEVRDAIVALSPDFFIVAAYTKIIPKDVLAIPRLGTIGVHPSLLPRYRGPSPIQTALLDGASETGMSLYLMNENLDEGPVLVQKKLDSYVVHDKNNEELSDDLFSLGGDMLVEIIPSFVRGEIQSTPQDHSKATFTKKFSTEDAFIEWQTLEHAMHGGSPTQTSAPVDIAAIIHQKILAFTPEPGVWTMRNGKRMKILKSSLQNGCLVLETIQYEGKIPSNSFIL